MSVKLDDKGTIRTAAEALQTIAKTNLKAVDAVCEGEIRKAYDEARRLVPVRTGYLRSTIYWVKKALASYSLGASASYAQFVEYGTSRMDARPFLRPALLTYFSNMEKLLQALARLVSQSHK